MADERTMELAIRGDESAQAEVVREWARKGRVVEGPIQPGDTVFVRTVTYHWMGRVVAISADWIVLEPATWVVDDERRFGESLRLGVQGQEREDIEGPAYVARAAITDVCPYHGPIR